MVTDTIRTFVERTVLRLLRPFLLVAPILGAVVILGWGTETLVAIGVPRTIAGSFSLLVVLALFAYVMYGFFRMIDW